MKHSYAETVSQIKSKQQIQKKKHRESLPFPSLLHMERLQSLSGEIKLLASLNVAKCHKGAD